MDSEMQDRELTINGESLDNAFCVIRESDGSYRYIAYCDQEHTADVLVNCIYKVGHILINDTDNPYLKALGEAVTEAVQTVIVKSQEDMDAQEEASDESAD